MKQRRNKKNLIAYRPHRPKIRVRVPAPQRRYPRDSAGSIFSATIVVPGLLIVPCHTSFTFQQFLPGAFVFFFRNNLGFIGLFQVNQFLAQCGCSRGRFYSRSAAQPDITRLTKMIPIIIQVTDLFIFFLLNPFMVLIPFSLRRAPSLG